MPHSCGRAAPQAEPALPVPPQFPQLTLPWSSDRSPGGVPALAAPSVLGACLRRRSAAAAALGAHRCARAEGPSARATAVLSHRVVHPTRRVGSPEGLNATPPAPAPATLPTSPPCAE